jgi:hypothetical protein
MCACLMTDEVLNRILAAASRPANSTYIQDEARIIHTARVVSATDSQKSLNAECLKVVSTSIRLEGCGQSLTACVLCPLGAISLLLFEWRHAICEMRASRGTISACSIRLIVFAVV